MFVSNDSSLVGDGDGNFGGVVEDNALTTKPTFNARVDGAIDKVFFFVGDFLNVLLSLFHVNMASRAGANAPAVVVQVYIVLLGQFEDGHVYKVALDGFGGNIRIFKQELDNSHIVARISFREWFV